MDESVTIATTRPELLCTCQLVAVNPDDASKAGIVGKRLKTPVFDRVVDVVSDDKVDPDFGTGVVMICTIGDKDDLDWVYKYELPLDMGIDGEGRMTSMAGGYEGLKVEEARAKVIEDMERDGLLIKQEEVEQSIGVCWRCHTPVEFLQMEQWFLKTIDFKDDILKMSEELRWFPRFLKSRLDDWINSLKWDWVISRQRYFATPIPVWECMGCKEIVPAKEEQCYVEPTVDKPPVDECPSCGGELAGCEDVFDTWMDSSISPLFNTFWIRDEEKFAKLFPMSLRPQAHDIVRTWTFYTMLRSKLLTDKKPWNDILMHGFIMAPDGKPMHTSLDNIIDPMPVLEEHGADAFRYYSTTCSLGKDSAFKHKEIVRGHKFCTKFWNVEKFVVNAAKDKVDSSDDLQLADRWILSKYTAAIEEVTNHMDNFDFNFAMKKIEQFIWHEFADHYLEMVKRRLDDEAAKYTLYTIGYGIVRLLAPFLSHIAEEAYQNHYREFEGEESVHVAQWPTAILRDEDAERKGEAMKDVIAAIRRWKASKGLKLNAEISLVKIVGDVNDLAGSEADIVGTVKVEELVMVEEEEISEEVKELKPNYEMMGTQFKENAKKIVDMLKKMSKNELSEVAKQLKEGEVRLNLDSGEVVHLTEEMVTPVLAFTHRDKELDVIKVNDFVLLLKP
jgi:valyl-tRNA synthetase